jgi:phage shock protein PspC (stress-responsive transcriptional regulator)
VSQLPGSSKKINFFVMKQVININFQGRVVPIEVTAFETLKAYIESLSRYFAQEDGKDEIINDIESRIGELFQERLKAGTTCITDEDVSAIIRSMGRPEDFETSDAGSASFEKAGFENQGTGSSTAQNIGSNNGPKRLFRNENDKVLGGVCSGLANYFGIDVVIVRIIFVVLAISFGFGLISYLILWVAVPSTATTDIGSARKKLYRDSDNKLVAGVCSGIGNYFGVNPWIPRVLFLLPFLGFISRWNHSDFSDFLRIGFSPGSLLVYVILWLVIPEALTTTEKLEMKGEKVDMNSIKNSIMEEMKGVQERAEKFGKQASSVAGEKSKMFAAEAGNVARRSGRSLGDIIALLFKIFTYFILGCIGFAFAVALFAFAVFSIGVFPIKDFLLTDGWQNAFAWGTLIFFIGVPIVGILTWLIRKIARIRNNSKTMRFSFISLWVIGWFCFISLIASVSRDFKASNSLNEEEVALVNPAVSKLEITSISPNQKIYRNRWFKFEPFEGLDEDTAYVGNISVHITKSPNDSFRVTMLKLSNGRTKTSANNLASMIEFNAVQKDSLLVIDKGIAINRTDKFRNQRIVLTVYVPVGKQIRINKSVGWSDHFKFEGPWSSDFDINFEGIEEGWNSEEDYIMKADGLYTLDGTPADEWKYNYRRDRERGKRGRNIIIDNDSNAPGSRGDNYRYRMDPIEQKLEAEKDRIKDSLEKAKEKIEKQLDKMGEKPKDPTAYIPTTLPGYNPLLIMN